MTGQEKKSEAKSKPPKFDPSSIESKWQSKWLKDKTYQPDLENAKRPFYNLMMFPYPSAEGMHVGNMYAQTGADIYGRFKRMQGYDVFEPIGLDGFGIHSENYALKVGTHPMDQAEKSEANFYRQMKSTGSSFAWDNTVETWKPEYYRFTQWIFTQLFKAGLAYRQKSPVNFCPSCKTVLADEQVIQKIKDQKLKIKDSADSRGDSPSVNPLRGVSPENAVEDQSPQTIGVCERCETPVEKREFEQWFFRITAYAQRLLEGLNKIDWTAKVKTAQHSWIGKSEGAKIQFPVVSSQLSEVASGVKPLRQENEGFHPLEINENISIDVFTTRPDTLYGATFLVLSPEHPAVEMISANPDVVEYVAQAKATSEQERIAADKEKTGVFSGAYAVNPVTNQQMPIWIADYVLMGYGTGAIMAVPAHDERDFEFAKKFDLPIKEVVAHETGVARENEERRDGGFALIFDPKTQKYGLAKYPDGIYRLYGGGTDDGEDREEGMRREVVEESGLYDFSYVEKIKTYFAHYYNSRKKVNRSALASGYLFIVKSLDRKEIRHEEHEVGMELVWLDADEILANWEKRNKEGSIDHWIDFMKMAVGRNIELGYDTTSDKEKYRQTAYAGGGILINSGDWDGLRVPEEKRKVIAYLEKKGVGKSEVNYHLRDWLISRQRYWGPPIPMIFCQVCADQGKSWFTTQGEKSEERTRKNIENFVAWNAAGWYPEENLPVLLPKIEDYKPLGGEAAPLANHPEFYETVCPECGAQARRETDVSDTFLDSSWYFMRYLATDLEHIPFPSGSFAQENIMTALHPARTREEIGSLSDEVLKAEKRAKWLPVTLYTGGAEHSVLHLLYTRFLYKVLYDLGYVGGSAKGRSPSGEDEPFPRFYAHGLIIKDGAKMSKSKGNVIVPDEYIRKFGADTLRTYLMFLGPFSQGGDFRDSGIEGINRFLKRVWTLVTTGLESFATQNAGDENHLVDPVAQSEMHKAIKGVTEDVENFRYNTAIAKIMTYYNFLSKKQSAISKQELEVLLKLLAPFAPHMTEELYQRVRSAWQGAGGDEKESTSHELPASSWSIHTSSWPSFDEKALLTGKIVVAVQINGKLRGTVEIGHRDDPQDSVVSLAKQEESVVRHLEGKQIKKIIYIPGKIINFVVA